MVYQCRAPRPVDCNLVQCDHLVVFSRHYVRAEWDQFVELEAAQREANRPGAGQFQIILVLDLPLNLTKSNQPTNSTQSLLPFFL